MTRRGTGLAALAAVAMLLTPLASARAEDPDVEGPQAASPALPELEAPKLRLSTPALRARPPTVASLRPPVLAKRKRDREFDTSMGEVDPRTRGLPRTHRFRLALHSHWVRLTRTVNPDTGESERFHYAPLMIDLGYQAQFLRYVMVRLALGLGANVANTRNAMIASIFPQAFVGVQTKIFGAAFGYGFDWAPPGRTDARAPGSNSLIQPSITRNHVVMGELSVTSRVDRVALTFALNLGGMKSNLVHYDTVNSRFRFYLGLSFGAFFDGTIRREKKARKQAEESAR